MMKYKNIAVQMRRVLLHEFPQTYQLFTVTFWRCGNEVDSELACKAQQVRIVSYSRASIQIQNVDTICNFCSDLGQPFLVLLHLLGVNLSQWDQQEVYDLY